MRYRGNNVIELPNAHDSFMFAAIYLFILSTPRPLSAVTPQLFMQISCPILAIVQHKVTIANK